MAKKQNWGGYRKGAGRPTMDDPSMKKRTVSISLTEKDISMLDQIAKLRGVSRSLVVQDLIVGHYSRLIVSDALGDFSG